MIKIMAGDSIKRYAAIYVQQLDYDIDEAIDEVVGWISSQVNGPWAEGYEKVMQNTPEGRFAEIKDYIRDQIANSTYGRIRESLNASLAKAA